MPRGRTSAQASDNTGACAQPAGPLLSLPAELRCIIFEYVCYKATPIHLSTWLKQFPALGLLCTCRHIYEEALPISRSHRQASTILKFSRIDADAAMFKALRGLQKGALDAVQRIDLNIGTADNPIAITLAPRADHMWDCSTPTVELSRHDRILCQSASWREVISKSQQLTPTYVGRRSADAEIIGAVKPSEVDWRRTHLAEIVTLCIARNVYEVWEQRQKAES